MHYLIDGHNLIAKLPGINLNDPNDEVELILRLKSWAAANPRRKVTVYFDGGLPGGIEQRLSTSGIKVIFAPEGRTADSLIIKQIHELGNPSEYTLITSDQQIIAAAQNRRLRHLRSEAFAAKMGQDAQKRAAPPSSPLSEADNPHISEREVAEWLELFGPEPETKKKPKPSPALPKKKAPKPQPRRSLQELKKADKKLNDDELSEWLDLFGD